MFKPRTIRTQIDWQDHDGAKIYTISRDGSPVNHEAFLPRFRDVKAARSLPWAETPHFAIFHQGVSAYLVVAWWGNDNELFTSVSVLTEAGWAERPDVYSFCVFDLEVFWEERNAFIAKVYCEHPDLQAYQRCRRAEWMR